MVARWLRSRWYKAMGYNLMWFSDDGVSPCLVCGKRVFGWQEHVTVFIHAFADSPGGPFGKIHAWHGDRHPELVDCLTGLFVKLYCGKSWEDWKRELVIPLRFVRDLFVDLFFVLRHPIKYLKFKKRFRGWGL